MNLLRLSGCIFLTCISSSIVSAQQPQIGLSERGREVIYGPEIIQNEVRSRLLKFFSDSKREVVADKSRFSTQIKYDTRNFKIHRVWSNGEISRVANDETGPSYQGFVLDVSILHEPQKELPKQAFVFSPYWNTEVIFYSLVDGSITPMRVLNVPEANTNTVQHVKILPQGHWVYEAWERFVAGGVIKQDQLIFPKAPVTHYEAALVTAELLDVIQAEEQSRRQSGQQETFTADMRRAEKQDLMQALRTEFRDEFSVLGVPMYELETRVHLGWQSLPKYIQIKLQYGSHTDKKLLDEMKKIIADFANEYSKEKSKFLKP